MDAAEELHGRIRPRWARVVGVLLIVLVLLGAAGLMVGVPLLTAVSFSLVDYVGVAVLALLICWFLYRQVTVVALPDQDGVLVRNLFVTRRVAWTQIVSVRFGQDRPWGYLDLADGESLPVMALQQADGAHGEAAARRLATLVALHEAEGL